MPFEQHKDADYGCDDCTAKENKFVCRERATENLNDDVAKDEHHKADIDRPQTLVQRAGVCSCHNCLSSEKTQLRNILENARIFNEALSLALVELSDLSIGSTAFPIDLCESDLRPSRLISDLGSPNWGAPS